MGFWFQSKLGSPVGRDLPSWDWPGLLMASGGQDQSTPGEDPGPQGSCAGQCPPVTLGGIPRGWSVIVAAGPPRVCMRACAVCPVVRPAALPCLSGPHPAVGVPVPARAPDVSIPAAPLCCLSFSSCLLPSPPPHLVPRQPRPHCLASADQLCGLGQVELCVMEPHFPCL